MNLFGNNTLIQKKPICPKCLNKFVSELKYETDILTCNTCNIHLILKGQLTPVMKNAKKTKSNIIPSQRKDNKISCEESNFLCSSCLKKMNKLTFENNHIDFCNTCRSILIDKSEFENIILNFLTYGKII